MNNIISRRAGFTLVEIMIVVAIIGLLAAMAMPNFVKVRKQSQGRRTMNDARQMDSAIDTWALENNMYDGNTVLTTSASTYLKTAWPTNDVIGNRYLIGTVGTNQVLVNTLTKSALKGVGIDWGSF